MSKWNCCSRCNVIFCRRRDICLCSMCCSMLEKKKKKNNKLTKYSANGKEMFAAIYMWHVIVVTSKIIFLIYNWLSRCKYDADVLFCARYFTVLKQAGLKKLRINLISSFIAWSSEHLGLENRLSWSISSRHHLFLFGKNGKLISCLDI